MALRVGSFSSIAGSLASVSAGTTNFAGETTQRFSFDAVSVRKPVRLVSVRAGSTSGGKAASGISFEPFRDMLDLALIVPTSGKESLARQRFVSECEVAINEQINVEYSVSYIYHALFAYFDRDNVALPGFAKYFKEASEEEREHAEKLMKYQNKRGGKVVFLEIIAPPTTDFSNEEKGDALATMELALTLEKLTMEKLYALHKVAEDACDVQLIDYIESEFLSEQVEAIKKVSEYVSQLRRIGKDGHGIYHFDRILGEEDA